MASRRPAEHRRKKKVRIPKRSPFPVPIATLNHVPAKPNYWFYYTGQLKEDHVTVSHSGDISFLYTLGFFGRGLMSRGAPDLHRSLPDVHIPTPDGSTDVLKVMRRRMYLRHRQWQLASEQSSVMATMVVPEEMVEFDSDVEYWDTPEQHQIPADHEAPYQPDYADQENSEIPTRKQPEVWPDSVMDTEQADSDEQTHGKDVWKDSGEADWDNTEADEDFWKLENTDVKGEVDRVDAWENTKPDTDFWGTEDKSEMATEGETKKSPEDVENKNLEFGANRGDRKNQSISNKSELRTKAFKEDDVENETFDRGSPPSKKMKVDDKDINTDISTLGETNNVENSEAKTNACDTIENITSSKDESQTSVNDIHISDNTDSNNSQNTEKEEGSSDIDTERKIIVNDQPVSSNTEDNEDIKTQSCVKEIGNDGCDIKGKIDVSNRHISVNIANNKNLETQNSVKEIPNDGCDIGREQKTEFENDSEDCPKDMVVDDFSGETSELLEAHPYCIGDDIDGQYLVVDDSDCDDRLTNIRIKKKSLWKPVRKQDVYPYNEPLILSLEEAFFLSYGLGCLTVRDQTNSAMSLQEMWCQFCCRKQQFLPSYVAYHYFRSKGWVPRSGIVFGVDFIVYRVGPPFYHGSYSVIIKVVHEGDYKEVERYTNRKLTWTSLAGLNRITEHVAKTLMFCYVVMPKSLTEEDLQSPSCLSQFKVRLQLVNRWVSSQEREKDSEPEIP